MTEEQKMQSRAQTTASRVVFALLVAYCVIGAATVVIYSAQLLHNPWENTYFESPQTYAALYAAQTGKLYIPMSQPPYTPQAYAPLYYATNAWIASAAHGNVDVLIVYSRLTTYIAYLLCGVMLFCICRAAAIPWSHSLMAALMMLAQPDFLGWNISPRPDMLYLLAMLLGLYCAIQLDDYPWLGYGLAGFFTGIAFLIKQPGAAVGMALFAVLILHRGYKKAAVLFAGSIIPVIITFSVLYWRQDPFFQQITFIGKSSWSIANAEQFVLDNLLKGYWIVPACIGVLGFAKAIRLDRKAQMIASFAFVNTLVGFSGIPQLGGYMNYLLPGLAGCALLLPYAIQMVQERPRLPLSMAIAGAGLLWAIWTGVSYDRHLRAYYPSPTNMSLAWLRPFRVLSDLTTMNVHGREPNLLDPFGAHVLELKGYWDSTPVLQGLSHGDYDLIILTRVTFRHVIPSFRGISYFSPAEVSAINENYEVLCSSLGSMVLKPRGRDVDADPEMFSRMFNQPCGTGMRRVALDLKLAPDAR